MKYNKAYLALMVIAALSAPAQAEIVVVVNPANPASRMFTEQAAQFFMGKSNQFTPIEQGKESQIRKDFYQKMGGKTLSQVEAAWAKIEFSGKGSMPKNYASDSAVKKAVAADPTAIAYIDKGSVDDSVKVILTLP